MISFEHGNIEEQVYCFILLYGGIEGEHHKQWVLDQVLRQLAGAAYPLLIERYARDQGVPWDTGIAP